MTHYFYTDANGHRQGPVSKPQLKDLAAQGIIGQYTSLETDTGHTGMAGQIPGLFATVPPPPSQPVSVPSLAPKQLFCTNCGKPVSEQAVACTSCGAKPVGHRKFCRHCAAALNPEQIVCVQCGAAMSGTGAGQLFSEGMERLSTLSTNFSSVKINGMTVGDITIIVAGALALISFCLPWLEAMVPLVGKTTKNGFSVGAFWLGIVFVYPVWMALTENKKPISAIGGFTCAGLGIVLGAICAAGMYDSALGDDPFTRRIAVELTSLGVGFYLFFCACIVLIVGIVLQHRQFKTP